MIRLQLTIAFAGNKMQNLFLVRFRYCHCCVSVIMQPSGYFYKSPFGTRSNLSLQPCVQWRKFRM